MRNALARALRPSLTHHLSVVTANHVNRFCAGSVIARSCSSFAMDRLRITLEHGFTHASVAPQNGKNWRDSQVEAGQASLRAVAQNHPGHCRRHGSTDKGRRPRDFLYSSFSSCGETTQTLHGILYSRCSTVLPTNRSMTRCPARPITIMSMS